MIRPLAALGALAVLVAGLLLPAPCTGAPTGAGVQVTSADHALREAELRELRDKVEALRRELAEAGGEGADAADALRESERAISEAVRALAELEARHASLQQQLGAQQAELGALAREQAAHQQMLARLLVEQHRRRQQEPLRMLLQGGGPYEVRRQLVYLRALNAARTDAIAGAEQRAGRATALRAETAARLLELDAVVQSARAQRAVQEKERRARRQTVARIGAQLEQRRRQLATAATDESRLARLVERLGALLEARARAAPRAARAPPPDPAARAADAAGNVAAGLARFKGLLKIPAAGELNARFGVPRNGNGPPWKGWFIRAPAGTAVQAVAAGKVVFADWLRGFGNLVIVDHGDGFMSLYGNNDALLQQVGTPIEAGQAVAQAGTSGGAAESGVYFELRQDGVAFDPKDWFGQH
ncbi:MAG: peptidoglycan DD-metalloendopeptidase family protein [Betaproteobacteria bacterium]|nr:peptidoglycan DD-metalloendopeptidase family protein [Betaproteobacteria bacterium]